MLYIFFNYFVLANCWNFVALKLFEDNWWEGYDIALKCCWFIEKYWGDWDDNNAT